MPQILFLGIYLDFLYLVNRFSGSKLFLELSRRAISQALVEPRFIPPRHPLKRRDFHLSNFIPSSGMDQLIFVGAVHVGS